MLDRLRPTTERDVFNTEKRFAQIDRLRQSLGLDPLDASFGQYVEVSKHTPTIGIEIEMSWRQAFPELGQEWNERGDSPNDFGELSPEYRAFSRAYNREDRRLSPLLKEIQQVIPRVGVDAYWEFSFLPSKHIGVTLAEVQTLYDAGILRDGIHYATHMTVAGIDTDPDAFAFLCGLELSGGSTEERILQAISSAKGSWARKGYSGVLKRRPEELMGTDKAAYEFRTLVASSQLQISSLLMTARQLSEMHADDPYTWRDFRSHMWSILRDNNLPLVAWHSPRSVEFPWKDYATLLNKKDA